MNELRLRYHRDTGIRMHEQYIRDDVIEYVEWLEEQLTDADTVNNINSLLFGRKIPIFYNREKDK